MVIGLALLPLAAVAQQQRMTHTITVGRRATLGIRYEFTSTTRDGKVNETLTVLDVIKDSPADRAGVKKGDRILRIGGVPVSEDEFASMARRVEPGDTVRLRIASGDRERDVTLVAADRPSDEAMFFLRGDSINRAVRIYLDSARAGVRFRVDSLFGDSVFMGRFPEMRMWTERMPDVRMWRGQMDSVFFRGWRDGSMHLFTDSMPVIWRKLDVPPEFDMVMPRFESIAERAVAGAEFTPINEGLAGYFGTDRGLLVVKVGPQTPAARAGLVAGDVITKVDGQVIDEVIELRRAVTRAGNETLKLEILRKGKARTLEFQPRVRR
jgi:predicted metalloprotease with PDZ domain